MEDDIGEIAGGFFAVMDEELAEQDRQERNRRLRDNGWRLSPAALLDLIGILAKRDAPGDAEAVEILREVARERGLEE